MRGALAPPIEKLDYWKCPVTGRNYPTTFKIENPSLDARFEVACTSKEQKLVSKLGRLTDVRTLSRLNHNSRPAQKSLIKWVSLHYLARLP